MSDMSIKGPEFWMRAWWCRDTPVQKFCGFTDWLNSVSVTGTAALSSPERKRWAKTTVTQRKIINFLIWAARSIVFVLSSAATCLSVWCLPCPRWGAEHAGCQCGALVLEEGPSLECLYCDCSCCTHTWKRHTQSDCYLLWGFPKMYKFVNYIFLYTVVIRSGSYLISISARLLASIRRQYLN